MKTGGIRAHIHNMRAKQDKEKKHQQHMNKRYGCGGCHYRTDDYQKISNHKAKYDIVYIHGIENPHQIQ